MDKLEELEFAAKAAGYQFHRNGGRPMIFNGEYWVPWRPREDDGDAFRLMVKLNLKVKAHDALHQALVWDGFAEYQQNIEDCENDPCAATRRAIVRAAAEIGRRMDGGSNHESR